MNFHWQSEGEEEGEVTPQAGVSSSRARHRMALLVVFVGLCVLTFTIWSKMQSYLETTTAAMEASVLSSHRLAQRAANEQDVDLFLILLPPENKEWVETQRERLVSNLLFAGAAHPFGLHPIDGAEGALKVTVSPTGHDAVVELRQPFVVARAGAVSTTVTLSQAHTYRKDGDSWLLSPPGESFWGTRQELDTGLISVVYPERDEEVVRRLADNLEETLQEMCALPDLDCPPDFHFHLRLSRDPATVLEAMNVETTLAAGATLTLPAITLVGRPLDSAAEEALFREYAAQVVVAAMSNLLKYDCCRHGLFFLAVVERQLAHLGLRPWPLGPAEYEALLEDGLSAADLYLVWAREPTPALGSSWHQALALAEFLEAAGSLEGFLSTSDAEFAPQLGTNNEQEFILAWINFVAQRSGLDEIAAPPQQLPHEKIQLVCFDGVTGVRRLLDYAVQDGDWSEPLTYVSTAGSQRQTRLVTLPLSQGFLVEEIVREPYRARFVWWRDDQQTVIVESGGLEDGVITLPLAAFAGAAPDGRRVAMRMVQGDYADKTMQRETTEYRLFDLEACARGACRGRLLAGSPIWSPDASRTLLQAMPDEAWPRNDEFAPTALYLADEEGQGATPVGRGFAPFWLDGRHYGYIQPMEEGTVQQIVIGSVTGTGPEVVGGTQEFADLLVDILPPGERLRLDRVESHSANPQQMLVWATRRPEAWNPAAVSHTYLFRLRLAADWQSAEEIQLLYAADGRLYSPPLASDRWLALAHGAEWRLLDLERGEARRIGTAASAIAWSNDGQWLVQRHENYLRLHAPARGYKQIVVRDLSSCSGVQWVRE